MKVKMTKEQAMAVVSKGASTEHKGNVLVVKRGSCKGLKVCSALDCLSNYHGVNVIFSDK
jgi:hypothetical protein